MFDFKRFAIKSVIANFILAVSGLYLFALTHNVFSMLLVLAGMLISAICMECIKTYDKSFMYYAIHRYENDSRMEFTCIDHLEMIRSIDKYRRLSTNASWLITCINFPPLRLFKLHNKNKLFSIMVLIPFLAALISYALMLTYVYSMYSSESIPVLASYICLYATVAIANAYGLKEIYKILKEYNELEKLLYLVKKEANIIWENLRLNREWYAP